MSEGFDKKSSQEIFYVSEEIFDGINKIDQLHSIQENEDDVDIGVGPAPEISDLLGSEYEHLYPKILYLVMADSAYCEDND
ncbi:Hypothetical predicted protein [Paramuricea clavata]|uniref:Uncharacterized protein n=1 Tax=Paramuricea clavata TaxID=317549 RepID=A0A6S7H2Y8_PARCT|nr:Hypothetical predicted protein [Paramuricea clavata]